MADLHVIDCLPAPDGDLIALLEDTLAKARAGEVSSVALAVVYRNGNTGDGWSTLPNMALQLGAVATLQYRLARRHDEMQS